MIEHLLHPAADDAVSYILRHDHHATHWPGQSAEEHIIWQIKAGQYFIARKGGAIAGYLRFCRFWTMPYIELIRVEPEWRGQQIGRQLVSALMDMARQEGSTYLLSSSQSNEPEAQAFHKAVGFVDMGRLSGLNDDGSDEVMFRLDL
ncbi:MAG: hypothetical protein Alpg2KO_20900 [Alphaproteobacteria bacterium]